MHAVKGTQRPQRNRGERGVNSNSTGGMVSYSDATKDTQRPQRNHGERGVNPNSTSNEVSRSAATKGTQRPEEYGGADMWVYGKTVKEKEVYIKITLGPNGSSVICISFHLAQHPMNYPLK